MSVLKFQFPLSAPQRADRSLLPGVFAGLLGLLLIGQLFLPSGSEVAVGQQGMVGLAQLASTEMLVPTDPAPILGRPLFAPRQSMISGSKGPAPVLGGASVAGSVTVRGRIMAIVRRIDGTVHNLPLGGALDGWRLVELTPSSARFRKGGERLDLPFGTVAMAGPGGEDSDEDDDE